MRKVPMAFQLMGLAQIFQVGTVDRASPRKEKSSCLSWSAKAATAGLATTASKFSKSTLEAMSW